MLDASTYELVHGVDEPTDGRACMCCGDSDQCMAVPIQWSKRRPLPCWRLSVAPSLDADAYHVMVLGSHLLSFALSTVRLGDRGFA